MKSFFSGLFSGLIFWSGAALAADVAITKDAAGNFTATTPNYTAKVGADGNLHSLNSGGTEFLLDGYRGLVGGGYIAAKEAAEWTAEAFKFTAVEASGADAVVATADQHKLTYKFLPDAIELAFSHTAEPCIWFLTVNPAIQDILEHDSGEPIAFKSVREGVPHLYAPSGANVILPPGSFWYSSRNAQKKLDTDPMLDQIWMPRTWGDQTFVKRIVVHAKPTAADAMQATLMVTRANHIFPAGAPAEVGIAGKMRFPNLTVDGEVELVVKDYLTKKEIFKKSEPFKLAAMGEGKVSFPVTPPAGFYDGQLTVKQGGEVLAARVFPLAYDIEHMTPPERPADFDRFWDATLAEQEKIPANLQLNLHKEEATHKLYKIRFDGLMGRQFHGWLSIPKSEGKFPAHLQLPPSGIHPPYMPYSGPGVVGMTLAIAGQETEPPVGYKNWDYFRSGIEKRETWYYRVIFAACSRAVDLLAARPEVDPSKIFVCGGSQGGGLTFITAALNPKVTMAVPGSPGLFGLEWKLRYLHPNYWPPIQVSDDPQKPADPKALEERIAVTRYGDAANFAPRIKCAILLEVGLQDVVTSQAGTLAAWQRLGNARIRAILADPWGGHNGPRGGQALGSMWFQKLVAGQVDRVTELTTADALPVIVEMKK